MFREKTEERRRKRANTRTYIGPREGGSLGGGGGEGVCVWGGGKEECEEMGNERGKGNL